TQKAGPDAAGGCGLRQDAEIRDARRAFSLQRGARPMSADHRRRARMCTLTGGPAASRRKRLRSAIVIVLAVVCAAPASVRAQEDPWGDAQRESESARAGGSPRQIDPPRPGEQKQDDTADDP